MVKYNLHCIEDPTNSLQHQNVISRTYPEPRNRSSERALSTLNTELPDVPLYANSPKWEVKVVSFGDCYSHRGLGRAFVTPAMAREGHTLFFLNFTFSLSVISFRFFCLSFGVSIYLFICLAFIPSN